MTPGPDDKAVKAEEKLAGRRIDQLGAEMVGVCPYDLGVEIGEESFRSDERPLILGNAMDLEIADPRELHLPLRLASHVAAASLRRRAGEVERAVGRRSRATSDIVAARRVSGRAAYAIEFPFGVFGEPLRREFLAAQRATREPRPSVLGIRPYRLTMTWLTNKQKTSDSVTNIISST